MGIDGGNLSEGVAAEAAEEVAHGLGLLVENVGAEGDEAGNDAGLDHAGLLRARGSGAGHSLTAVQKSAKGRSLRVVERSERAQRIEGEKSVNRGRGRKSSCFLGRVQEAPANTVSGETQTTYKAHVIKRLCQILNRNAIPTCFHKAYGLGTPHESSQTNW